MLKWGLVFKKFIKGFIVTVLSVIIVGIINALANYQPPAGMEAIAWGVILPLLVGFFNAMLNYLKHKDDGKKAPTN